MGEAVDAGREQRFRVAQIIFMGEYADVLLMRFIDDGLIDFGLYFHAVAQPVVHPHLHEVGMMRRKFADIGAGFVRSLRAVAMVRGI